MRHDPFYSIVGPRPIGWISSLDRAGRSNLAPYSFFNAFCDEPHIIGFCSNGWKDTVRNVSETGQFVWNLATRQYAPAMNASSASVPHETDEFELCGLSKAPSVDVGAFRVKESPVNFECLVSQIVRLQDHAGNPADAWMVFGEVVHVHIDRSLVVDGIYRTPEAHPILRGGGSGEYLEVRADAIFRMAAPP
jgi:flavin reductase (DIM6/NTAB) family NADH-FMN oxidoreductase RutF